MARIEDLGRHTLLVDEVTRLHGKGPGWPVWFQAAGFKDGIETRTRRFGQANMVVQAAIEGLGVALGREPLVVDELNAGRLVRPFEVIAASDFAYFLVCPKDRLEDRRVRAFRDWLLQEAARMTSPDRLIADIEPSPM